MRLRRYRYIFRSSVSGRIVSRWYAITHPSTTTRERVERKP